MKLLERESQLRELDGALKSAIAGEGRVALIYGEPGIGKTFLVEQFSRERRDSARVLWAVCDALFTPHPLGPLHDIAAQTKGELLTLLKDASSRQAIFSACLSEMQRQPTILVFEDVHWADEATLDLIKFLGRRIQHTAALLILTYRDDELDGMHPLRLVLGELLSSVTLRLPLLPLSQASVTALARDAEQDERAGDLFAVTGGNPFFLSEVLANSGANVPPTVRDAVMARAARLSPAAREVINAASVVPGRIERWLLGAEPKDYLERMTSAVNRMQEMIDDLLELSRVNSRDGNFVEVDLAEAAYDVVSNLETRILAAQGQVVLEPLPAIEGDAMQMRELLQNLIGNAIKYHQPGVPPLVRVSAKADPGKLGEVAIVSIQVEDNGIGFEEAQVERIFQPFQRLHRRGEYEGTGIGLSICKKIVERHRGRITAHSRLGEGSTFIVTLPLKQTI